MLYEPTLVTAPTMEPVSVSEVKDNSLISHCEDDVLLQSLIQAARELIEEEVPGGKQLMSATYDYVLPCFPGAYSKIHFPKPPLQSIAWVKYYDQTNTLQTLSSSKYYVVTHGTKPGYVYPAKDEIWPSTEAQRADAVQIRFVAGYATIAEVPQRAKQAIKLLVGHWYEDRESAGSSGGKIERAYQSLITSLGWGGGFV